MIELGVSKIEPDRPGSIAWGQPVGGIKVGISFQNSPFDEAADRVRLGNNIKTELSVQNVSDIAIDLPAIAPSLVMPTVRNAKGEHVMVVMPPHNGPAILQTHHLQPGQSIRLPLPSLGVAPRSLLHTNACQMLAGIGTYTLSASLSVSPLNDNTPPPVAKTGTIKCTVVPANKDEITQRLTDQLKQRTDSLSCKIVYLGMAEPKLHSVGLMNESVQEQYPAHWTTIQIDRKVAAAIVDFLAEEGLLYRYVADPVTPDPFLQASYFLSVDADRQMPRFMMIPLRWSRRSDRSKSSVGQSEAMQRSRCKRSWSNPCSLIGIM